MIAVDSSAVVAILARETGYEALAARLYAARSGAISTGNLLELQLVVGGRPVIGDWRAVEELLTHFAVAPRPFDAAQLTLSREAAIRFGKGRHKASLNFGDCFAYALAKSEDIPLLCTGGDFALTDVSLA